MSLSAEDKAKLSRFLKSPIMQDSVNVSSGWENFMKTQHQSDAIVIDIDNRMALQSLMKEIQALNENKSAEERVIVRAAAGGRRGKPYSHSFSATQLVNADIVVRLTGPEFTDIKRRKNSNTVRAGASVQIGELDKTLYETHGLVLSTASLIPYVTVAGLTATGGHGTGKDEPSVAGLVRGVTMCLENGEIVHIDQSHPDFATIMGANNGMFGIVLNMDLECIPRMKMQCVMEVRSPIEFMEEVEQGLFQNDPYVSVMYVPNYLPDEATNRTVNNVIIYRWRPAPLDTKNVNFEPCLDNFEQKVQTKLGAAVNIPEILRTYPKLVPFYLRHIVSPLSVGDKESLSVGPWPDMMHYRTEFPDDLDEICGIFPVKDQALRQKQGTEIVQMLQHTIKLLDEHAKRGEYPLTLPLYFRFIQGTHGGLSTTDAPAGHHICAVDLTTNENVKGFAEFKQSMQDYFLNNMHGKFHWGKNAPMDIDYEKIYGERWKETKTALEKWHQTYNIKTEKSVLLNPLMSHVFHYPPPSLVDTDTLPQRVQNTDKNYRVAVNANKLAKLVTDRSPEAQQIKTEINADMKARGCTLFSSGKATPPANTEESKSTCVIL